MDKIAATWVLVITWAGALVAALTADDAVRPLKALVVGTAVTAVTANLRKD